MRSFLSQMTIRILFFIAPCAWNFSFTGVSVCLHSIDYLTLARCSKAVNIFD